MLTADRFARSVSRFSDALSDVTLLGLQTEGAWQWEAEAVNE